MCVLFEHVTMTFSHIQRDCERNGQKMHETPFPSSYGMTFDIKNSRNTAIMILKALAVSDSIPSRSLFTSGMTVEPAATISSTTYEH